MLKSKHSGGESRCRVGNIKTVGQVREARVIKSDTYWTGTNMAAAKTFAESKYVVGVICCLPRRVVALFPVSSSGKKGRNNRVEVKV